MYLLEDSPAPDHAIIARFRTIHFTSCSKQMLAQMSDILYKLGETSGKDIFIDGIKIEECANKYTFVLKKAITKNLTKLLEKFVVFVEESEEEYGIKVVYHNQVQLHHVKKLRKKLYKIKKGEGITIVNGIGKRKTAALQKSI